MRATGRRMCSTSSRYGQAARYGLSMGSDKSLARVVVGLSVSVCLMVVYLPFHVVGLLCDAVGRHVVHLAERCDEWLA
jgi:hypothetical protein